MYISIVRALLYSAAVTSKGPSAPLIVRFYPLKRKESSPVATVGSQRLGYLSDVMAHCSFTTLEPAGKPCLPSPPLASHVITVSVAGDLSAVIQADTSVWLSGLRDRGATRAMGVSLLEEQTLKRGCHIVFPSLFLLHHFTGCFGGAGQRLVHEGEVWAKWRWRWSCDCNCRERWHLRKSRYFYFWEGL